MLLGAGRMRVPPPTISLISLAVAGRHRLHRSEGLRFLGGLQGVPRMAAMTQAAEVVPIESQLRVFPAWPDVVDVGGRCRAAFGTDDVLGTVEESPAELPPSGLTVELPVRPTAFIVLALPLLFRR